MSQRFQRRSGRLTIGTPVARRAAAEDACGEHGSAEEVDDRREAVGVGLELEVVDRHDRGAVHVVELAVEQVQARVEHEPGRRRRVGQLLVGREGALVAPQPWAHPPAPVAIIRGIAARDAATMMTR